MEYRTLWETGQYGKQDIMGICRWVLEDRFIVKALEEVNHDLGLGAGQSGGRIRRWSIRWED